MKETVLSSSNQMVLHEGFEKITIDSNEEVTLHLICTEKGQSSLFVECRKAKAVNLLIEVQDFADCTLFFWNSSKDKLSFHDEAHVGQDALLKLSYGELSEGSFERKSEVHLDKEGAKIQLHTATLSSSDKRYELNCMHHARHTHSMMKNYFVLLKEGRCHMDAIGKIDKGASGSKSHQISRGLTFDQQKRAIILPQLLIDENDVEASHATTLGQIDENQMYYLQSRGLTRKEATQLITYGYLLPVTDGIEDEQLRTHCRNEIEMRVNQSCSM